MGGRKVKRCRGIDMHPEPWLPPLTECTEPTTTMLYCAKHRCQGPRQDGLRAILLEGWQFHMVAEKRLYNTAGTPLAELPAEMVAAVDAAIAAKPRKRRGKAGKASAAAVAPAPAPAPAPAFAFATTAAPVKPAPVAVKPAHASAPAPPNLPRLGDLPAPTERLGVFDVEAARRGIEDGLGRRR